MRGVGTNKEVFTTIYQTNHWKSAESVSGPGSELIQTKAIRDALPKVICKYSIKTMLDAPCGDFNWMQKTDLTGLEHYEGMDIVEEIIMQNNLLYSTPNTQFVAGDITTYKLKEFDLIFCRDCLVHLSHQDSILALNNFISSGSHYLLTTSYVHEPINYDTKFGKWRPLNLQLAPFNLPEPLLIIDTEYTNNGTQHPGNGMALWDLRKLPLIK